jgi:energy-coupling factor transporter ATP-binding protein EcfA2
MLHERYPPENLADCVVHTRAAAVSVFEWLRDRLDDTKRKEDLPKYLLLLGPSGCGKTALVKALCQELKAHLNRPAGVDSMAKLFSSVQSASFARTIGAKTIKDVWLYTGIDGYVLYEEKKKETEPGAGLGESEVSKSPAEASKASKASTASTQDQKVTIKKKPPRSADRTSRGSGGGGARIPPAVTSLLNLVASCRASTPLKKGETRPVMAPVIFTAHDCPTSSMQAIKNHPSVKVVYLNKIPEATVLKLLRSTVAKDAVKKKAHLMIKVEKSKELIDARFQNSDEHAEAGEKKAMGLDVLKMTARLKWYLTKITAECASERGIGKDPVAVDETVVAGYQDKCVTWEQRGRQMLGDCGLVGEEETKRRGRLLKRPVSSFQLQEMAVECDGDMRKALIALEAAMYFDNPVGAMDHVLDVFAATKTLLDLVIRPEDKPPKAKRRVKGSGDGDDGLGDLYTMATDRANTLWFVHSNMYASLEDKPHADNVDIMADMADAWSSCFDKFEKVGWKNALAGECAVLAGIKQMAASGRQPWTGAVASHRKLKFDERFKSRDAWEKMTAVQQDGGRSPPQITSISKVEYNERMSLMRTLREGLRTGSVVLVQPQEDQVAVRAHKYGLDPATASADPFYFNYGVTTRTMEDYIRGMNQAMAECNIADWVRPTTTVLRDGILQKT